LGVQVSTHETGAGSKSEREPLTERQQVILEFLKLYMEKYGRSPTWWEICNAFEFKSVNAACIHLKALTKKGYIRKRMEGRQLAIRGLEIIP
jgi:SOS-response transcriptional repressor LexA